MKKQLSAYWWCQIIGWGLYLLVESFFYFFVPNVADFPNYYSVIITVLIGLFTTHLMRYFIMRTGLLNLKIARQFVAFFLTTIVFSVILFVFQSLPDLLYDYTYKFTFSEALSTGIYLNVQCIGIWNLIYFIHYYVEKTRKDQIATVRLESELKIQQLESEKAQIEYQRNLGSYYLMALRYQMNPHFIFNCLNSIKLYIAQNDTASASDYLTKFSKLIRLVLENSAKGKILLSSELDMLRLYIDLEAMRFKQKLQYHIHLEKNVEPDYIELPPLLLQPYVENAIWHGLMPKEEGGTIQIGVALDNDTSVLKISIVDNGVGREKSTALKNGKAIKQESYGMRVTSDRIALINQVYKSGADVMIDDLMDENNHASGTKVSIQIPV